METSFLRPWFLGFLIIFFQAEDGVRDVAVTGVQTCALPIYMALAISWDMLLRSGQISFGIAGFFGLGAYAAALGVLRAGLSPLVSLLLAGPAKALYWVILAAVVLAVAASALFERSRLRLALTAIRNNEVSAASGGIHIFKYLVVAFVVSSFLQGVVGGIQVQGYGFA